MAKVHDFNLKVRVSIIDSSVLLVSKQANDPFCSVRALETTIDATLS
ncbi:MAG: hypothetical protein H6823_08190 [Planctomycetaceae bacterium]|nr:hypothetical protein [Planctomycetaceae bacterium]